MARRTFEPLLEVYHTILDEVSSLICRKFPPLCVTRLSMKALTSKTASLVRGPRLFWDIPKLLTLLSYFAAVGFGIRHVGGDIA